MTKIPKRHLLSLLSERIVKQMTQVSLQEEQKRLNNLLEGFDMDDFLDGANAAKADIDKEFGQGSFQHLGSKEDAGKFMDDFQNASEEDVDQHAPHLRDKYENFNEKLIRFLSQDPTINQMRDGQEDILLDSMAVAMYKYMMDHNSRSPFISAIQEWIVGIDPAFDPTDDDGTIDMGPLEMKIYKYLGQFEVSYNKEKDKVRLNESDKRISMLQEERAKLEWMLSLNEATTEQHYSIVFLQGEEAYEPLDILDQKGEDAVLEYLMQWYPDRDGHLEPKNQPIRGSQDHEFRKEVDGDKFIVNWNNKLPYIGLSMMKVKEIDVPHNYDDLYDGAHGTYGELDEVATSTYEYHINLDERGQFYADVRNENGDTVYEIKVGYGEEEDNNVFEDGFMQDKTDLRGLEDHLKELGFMKHGAKLVSGDQAMQEEVIPDEQDIALADEVGSGHFIMPPTATEPMWSIVDASGAIVQQFNSEEEANAAMATFEQEANDTDEEFGVTYKEQLQFERMELILDEVDAILNEYGNVPAGADSDPNAPWHQDELNPAKPRPKAVFSFVDRKNECVVLSHGGETYVMNLDGLTPDTIKAIAIDHVGVPSDAGAEGDVNYDASGYSIHSSLPDQAIVDYVNDNVAALQIGDGLSGWEDGSNDLVKVDDALAQELRQLYTGLAV
jgi:hypothetical protein